jgi:hypothetical protein
MTTTPKPIVTPDSAAIVEAKLAMARTGAAILDQLEALERATAHLTHAARSAPVVGRWQDREPATAEGWCLATVENSAQEIRQRVIQMLKSVDEDFAATLRGMLEEERAA